VRWGPDRRRLGPHQNILFLAYIKCLSGIGAGSRPDAVSQEWLDRAEQAREVAGQLADPSARKAVLELAESFDRLARAAATPAVLRRRELATKDQ
jgi:hypothetical protein